MGVESLRNLVASQHQHGSRATDLPEVNGHSVSHCYLNSAASSRVEPRGFMAVQPGIHVPGPTVCSDRPQLSTTTCRISGGVTSGDAFATLRLTPRKVVKDKKGAMTVGVCLKQSAAAPLPSFPTRTKTAKRRDCRRRAKARAALAATTTATTTTTTTTTTPATTACQTAKNTAVSLSALTPHPASASSPPSTPRTNQQAGAAAALLQAAAPPRRDCISACEPAGPKPSLSYRPARDGGATASSSSSTSTSFSPSSPSSSSTSFSPSSSSCRSRFVHSAARRAAVRTVTTPRTIRVPNVRSNTVLEKLGYVISANALTVAAACSASGSSAAGAIFSSTALTTQQTADEEKLRSVVRACIPGAGPSLSEQGVSVSAAMESVAQRSGSLTAPDGTASHLPARQVECVEATLYHHLSNKVTKQRACRKSVYAFVSDDELAPLAVCLASGEPFEHRLSESVTELFNELGVTSAVHGRIRNVFGEEAQAQCFQNSFGWDVEAVPGTEGCFRLVTYSDWEVNGTVRQFLADAAVHGGADFYSTVINALTQAVQVLWKCERAGIVLGDWKLENVLVNNDGWVRFIDLDGAGMLPSAAVKAVLAAGTYAARRWLALQDTPSDISTDAYAPPETLLGRVLHMLMVQQLPVAHVLEWAREEAWGAVLLFECTKASESQQAAADIMESWGERAYMCGASHAFLFGASLISLASKMYDAIRRRPLDTAGDEREAHMAFVVRLAAVGEACMVASPAGRPDCGEIIHKLNELLKQVA